MKNIVIIIPSLQFWWGAEKVASILGTELHKEWYDISYLTFYDSKETNALWNLSVRWKTCTESHHTTAISSEAYGTGKCRKLNVWHGDD